jgi:hypothetical protein
LRTRAELSSDGIKGEKRELENDNYTQYAAMPKKPQSGMIVISGLAVVPSDSIHGDDWKIASEIILPVPPTPAAKN